VNHLRPYGALVLATLCWGVEITVSKYAIEGLGSFTTLFIETGTAAVVLWTFMLRSRPRREVPLREFAVLGLVEPFVCYGALNLGLRGTGAANAALLIALLPVMVLVLGVIFVKEKVTRRSLLAVLIATAGGVLLVVVHVTAKVGLSDALVLVACLAAAASVLLVNRMSGRATVLEITAYQFGFGFLATIPVAIIEWATGNEALPSSAQLSHVAAAAAIGLGGFALAYAAYNYAVAHVSVSTAGIALNLIPLFGVVSAILWLGEELSAFQWFAAALIIAGLTIFPHTAELPDPVEYESPAASADAPNEKTRR
jgi:drug/metabolite transporter (DMT)-like permease